MSAYPGMYQSVTMQRGCQCGKESVSAWRKCRSSLGHVDGGAALQRLQDPMAPVSPVPQTDWEHLGSVSASGPRGSDLYDGGGGGGDWIRERENMSQIPRPCAKRMLCQ